MSVVHFVMYGSYTAACGWSIHNQAQNNGNDQTVAQWSDFAAVFRGGGRTCCEGCVEHARRVGVLPYDLPRTLDPGDVETWLNA